MRKKISDRIFLTVFFFIIGWGGIIRGEINLTNDITLLESTEVAVPTPGLFNESDRITIDFTQLDTTEWCFPLSKSKFLSPFGIRNGRPHTGTDLKPTTSDTIRAAFTGRVRFVNMYYGYGNVIIIRHSSGLETLYSHNKKQLVKCGDFVKAGQPIAIAGRTGRATTIHLHFEVRLNGQPINPALIFNVKEHQLLPIRFIAHKSRKIEKETNE